MGGGWSVEEREGEFVKEKRVAGTACGWGWRFPGVSFFLEGNSLRPKRKRKMGTDLAGLGHMGACIQELEDTTSIEPRWWSGSKAARLSRYQKSFGFWYSSVH